MNVKDTLYYLQELTGINILGDKGQQKYDHLSKVKQDQIEELIARLPEDSHAWEAVKLFISEIASTELFMGIKNEMGMKGFWYVKGYVRGLRDFVRRVEAAHKKRYKDAENTQKTSKFLRSGDPLRSSRREVVARPDANIKTNFVL